jgi:hypothetical protein
MAALPVGPAHAIAGVIHAQIFRDPAQTDPGQAFSVQINAPNCPQQTLPLNNAASLDFPISSGKFQGTIHVQVDDFRLLPAGASGASATAIACTIVFQLVEFFKFTIGSVPVTASLK